MYDTKKSHSLLKQLGSKDEHIYLDSRSPVGLARATSRGPWPTMRMPFEPYLEKNMYKFDEWWNEKKFKVGPFTFNRKELVILIADQEGGAHVDPKVDRRIARLNRNNAAGWYSIGSVGASEPMIGFELASICGIGDEILYTFSDEENRKKMFIF